MRKVYKYGAGSSIAPMTANSGFDLGALQGLLGGAMGGSGGGGGAKQILGGMFGSGATPTSPWSIAGGIADVAGSFIPKKEQHQSTEMADAAYDQVANTLMAIPGWGCVCAGTRVVDSKGRFINIEDLKQEDGIIGWNNGQINKEEIVAFIDPHEKECVEIELQSGNKLRCSIDHPILCSKGKSKEIRINDKRYIVKLYEFIRADKIEIGDNLGIANEIDIWGDESLPNAYLIGMLIGDGSYSKDHGVRLYSADPDTWTYIEKNQLGGKINYDDSRYNKEFRCYHIFNGASNLRGLGIYEQTRQNKTLPIDIYKYNKESISSLLAGLFDTDGCIYFNEVKKDYKIYLSQSNLPLIKQIQEQLLKLGIHTSLQTYKERESQINGRIIHSKVSYRINIKDRQSIINFYKYIKLNISYKRNSLENLYQYVLSIKNKDNRQLSGAKADKVIKITNIGLQTIYNLQADDDHTYLANGIITHNTIAGGIMKVGGLLSDGLTAMGVGTDGQTKLDRALDSKFLKLTPLGLVNAIGAKKTRDFEMDQETYEDQGSAYGGTYDDIQDAEQKAGKKYGLLSNRKRKQANAFIDEAERKEDIIQDINEEAQTNLSAQRYFGNSLRSEMLLNGGHRNMAVGRHGMSLQLISKSKEIAKKYQQGGIIKRSIIEAIAPEDIPEFKDGGQIIQYTEIIAVSPEDIPEFKDGGQVKPKYEDWIKTISSDRLSDNYDLEKAFEVLPWDMLENWRKASDEDLRKGKYHLMSIYQLPNGDYEFLKLGTEETNPEVHFETEQYHLGNTGLQWTHDLVFDKDRNRYYYKKKTEKFQEGGSINVIPEGALHARKHNMDMEGITKKGIPVIAEGEDGEIEQQAEIERAEIILRLEVTKKLEELEEKYYDKDTSNKEKDEYALEAGQLLVQEILYNTQDNANLINQV